jgi:hypothetical protein
VSQKGVGFGCEKPGKTRQYPSKIPLIQRAGSDATVYGLL